MNTIQEIDVKTLKQRLDAGDDLLLLDIREPQELVISRLPEADYAVMAIPLSQINQHWQDIPRERTVVVFCHAGARSAYLIRQLQTVGFTNLLNMTGGIDAWSIQVDPSIPRY